MTLPTPLFTTHEDRLGGKPVFAGTRVPVKSLFDHFVAGDSLDVFLTDFPSVSRAHALAVLELAHQDLVARTKDEPVAAE